MVKERRTAKAALADPVAAAFIDGNESPKAEKPAASKQSASKGQATLDDLLPRLIGSYTVPLKAVTIRVPDALVRRLDDYVRMVEDSRQQRLSKQKITAVALESLLDDLES